MEAVQTNLAPMDAEGFLLDPAMWNSGMANAIAAELGIALTPEHWKVLEAARAEFAEAGQSPGLRKLSKRTGLPMKTFYDLFPDGPGKKIARVAGIPKPKSCL